MNRMYRPELTTIRQPSDAMGRSAVAHLSNLITTPSATPVQHWLNAELIVRGSCGCSFSQSQSSVLPRGKEGGPFGSGPDTLIAQT
jgi:hypothetical protein